jgi:hypothetical protein
VKYPKLFTRNTNRSKHNYLQNNTVSLLLTRCVCDVTLKTEQLEKRSRESGQTQPERLIVISFGQLNCKVGCTASCCLLFFADLALSLMEVFCIPPLTLFLSFSHPQCAGSTLRRSKVTLYSASSKRSFAQMRLRVSRSKVGGLPEVA